MQNLGDISLLLCTPTWPSQHVSQKQELHVEGNSRQKFSCYLSGIRLFFTVLPFNMRCKKSVINPKEPLLRYYVVPADELLKENEQNSRIVVSEYGIVIDCSIEVK